MEHTPGPTQAGRQPGDADATSPAPSTEAVWEKVLEINSLADMFATHEGKPLAAHLRNTPGGLNFSGSEGGVSKQSFPASEGQVFRATSVATVHGEGELLPLHFGPMFIDARDRVLYYSATVPVREANKPISLDVTHAAPPGTVLVRLRAVGTWMPGKDASHLSVSYERPQLFLRRS